MKQQILDYIRAHSKSVNIVVVSDMIDAFEADVKKKATAAAKRKATAAAKKKKEEEEKTS